MHKTLYMRRILATVAVTASLAGAPVGSAGLEDWDADDDGALTETEWRAALDEGGLFAEWAGDDDLLSEDELAAGLYALWDENEDGELSVDEWDTGVDLWFGEREVDLSVSAWDSDGDGVLSREEFRDGLASTDLFARIEEVSDDDVLVDETEFSEGVFDVADVDADSLIGGEEDGLLVEMTEAVFADDSEDEEEDVAPGESEVFGEEPPLIERGVSFTELPIPCGGDGGETACADTAERFCTALGYEPPIDFVGAEGQLYVVRCEDEF